MVTFSMSRFFSYFVLGILIIFFCLASVFHSVKSYAFDLTFYGEQYVVNGVVEHFNQTQLDAATAQLFLYLNNKPADLSFFSERDRIHLVDVQRLFQRGFVFYEGLLISILILIVLLRFLDSQHFFKNLSTLFLASGILNSGIVIFAALLRHSFDVLFIKFHLIAFDNFYWILNPSEDRLVQLFPEAFWYAVATKIVLQVLFFSVIFLYSGIFIMVYPLKQPHKP